MIISKKILLYLYENVLTDKPNSCEILKKLVLHRTKNIYRIMKSISFIFFSIIVLRSFFTVDFKKFKRKKYRLH